jgi:hypothetical protein
VMNESLFFPFGSFCGGCFRSQRRQNTCHAMFFRRARRGSCQFGRRECPRTRRVPPPPLCCLGAEANSANESFGNPPPAGGFSAIKLCCDLIEASSCARGGSSSSRGPLLNKTGAVEPGAYLAKEDKLFQAVRSALEKVGQDLQAQRSQGHCPLRRGERVGPSRSQHSACARRPGTRTGRGMEISASDEMVFSENLNAMAVQQRGVDR